MLDGNAKTEVSAWLDTMGKRQELRENADAAAMERQLIEETLFAEGARTDTRVRAVFHYLKTREGLMFWPNAPQIRSAVAAIRRNGGEATGAKAGDRQSLSFDEQAILEDKILPTARRWLTIPGLRDQAIRTLEFWGEKHA